MKLVISGIGRDRVGLIERISKYVMESNCNIEDSRMAVFYGEIASIFLISGSEEALSRLASRGGDLEDETGLRILMKRVSDRGEVEGSIYSVRASCLDHPGIVYRITRVFSEAGINIEAMETAHYYAPTSGAPMFRFEAEISIPSHLNVSRLRAQLEGVGEEENIDIELIRGSLRSL